MKEIFSLIFTLLISSLSVAQNSTDDFSGQWKTAEGNIVEITKLDLGFIGKPKGKDIVVLKDLLFINGNWKGTLNNPQKNTTANCEAYLEGNKIRFVAKKGIMKKEILWTKID
jgi:uncharacterized protein (DUF2147 family)